MEQSNFRHSQKKLEQSLFRFHAGPGDACVNYCQRLINVHKSRTWCVRGHGSKTILLERLTAVTPLIQYSNRDMLLHLLYGAPTKADSRLPYDIFWPSTSVHIRTITTTTVKLKHSTRRTRMMSGHFFFFFCYLSSGLGSNLSRLACSAHTYAVYRIAIIFLGHTCLGYNHHHCVAGVPQERQRSGVKPLLDRSVTHRG